MKDRIATLHAPKKGGHYARLMGTLHRHKKVESAGDAALGMLARIWSYCADTKRVVLSDLDMARIMARDKNGPRKLRALLDARLLDQVEGGYSPHDWFDHNPGLKPSNDVQDAMGDVNAFSSEGEREANVTGNVTRKVRKPPEENQTLRPDSSRPRTQELRENSELRSEQKTAASAAAPDGAGPAVLTLIRFFGFFGVLPHESPAEPKKSKKRDERKLLFTATLKAESKELGFKSAPDVSGKVRDTIIRRAAEESKGTGASFAEALRARIVGGLKVSLRTGKLAQWAIKDWEPGKGSQPPQSGRVQISPATTHEDFKDAEPLDVQLARLRSGT